MPTIICLGDSVTQGLGGDGVQHAEADRWPSVLAQATGATVYNRGVGGETTALALDRFHTQVAPLLPATVLIAFGINDCYVCPWRTGPRVGLDEFRRNLVELGAWTVRLGGSPVLVAPHRQAEQAHAQGNGATLQANLAPYAAAVVAVAAEHGWGCLDLREALAPADLDRDGVHLTPAGSRRYGGIVAGRQPSPPRLPSTRTAAALAAGTPRHVVVYGTSLTAGGAWVEQVQRRAALRRPDLLRISNSGQGAMWSRWGVDNLDERVIALRPDCVLIEFGINDAFAEYATSVAQARSNLVAMVTRIRAALPGCEVVLLTMNQPTGEHAGRRPAFAAYAAMYREAAVALATPLIDLLPAWERLLAADPACWHALVPDGIHPEAAGSALVTTPAVAQALLG